MINDSFKKLRKEYQYGALEEQDVSASPFLQFKTWYKDAEREIGGEVNAMALATIANQRPSQRMLLLKDYGKDLGFVFFTNYQSRKGIEIESNPNASLLFFWSALERQVRIEGVVCKIERKKSEEYFSSRPKSAQYAAMASNQSRQLQSRQELELAYMKLADTEPRCPEHWGGYSLMPQYFEFWQGRESRLHDRIVYQLHNSEWKIRRLAP